MEPRGLLASTYDTICADVVLAIYINNNAGNRQMDAGGCPHRCYRGRRWFSTQPVPKPDECLKVDLVIVRDKKEVGEPKRQEIRDQLHAPPEPILAQEGRKEGEQRRCPGQTGFAVADFSSSRMCEANAHISKFDTRSTTVIIPIMSLWGKPLDRDAK